MLVVYTARAATFCTPVRPRAPPCPLIATPTPRPSQVWGLTGMILAVPMTAVRASSSIPRPNPSPSPTPSPNPNPNPSPSPNPNPSPSPGQVRAVDDKLHEFTSIFYTVYRWR